MPAFSPTIHTYWALVDQSLISLDVTVDNGQACNVTASNGTVFTYQPCNITWTQAVSPAAQQITIAAFVASDVVPVVEAYTINLQQSSCYLKDVTPVIDGLSACVEAEAFPLSLQCVSATPFATQLSIEFNTFATCAGVQVQYQGSSGWENCAAVQGNSSTCPLSLGKNTFTILANSASTNAQIVIAGISFTTGITSDS